MFKLTLGRPQRSRNRGSSPDDPPRARPLIIYAHNAYRRPGHTHEDQGTHSSDESSEESSEEELEEPRSHKAKTLAQRERKLSKILRVVFLPRVNGLRGEKPPWASLSAKEDDPEAKMKFKEFRWAFTEILASQDHRWQIP